MDELAATSITADHKIEAYPIEIKRQQLPNETPRDSSGKGEMLLKCKSCGKLFDSTFTTADFALLPKDQNESGTLHLCPHCGQLSIYLLKDYAETDRARP